MSAETEFFLGAPSADVYLQTVEISHPNFTQTYWLVQNSKKPIVLRLESGADQEFVYCPMMIRRLDIAGHLDTGLQITLGDVGVVIAKVLQSVRASDDLKTKPILRYRCWRSSATDQILTGPWELQIDKISRSHKSCTFDAIAPKLNVVATGEIYNIERFPALRGML